MALLDPYPPAAGQPEEASSGAELAATRDNSGSLRRMDSLAATSSRTRCPSCGWLPDDERQRARQRQDLMVTWLYPDPSGPEELRTHQHCARCQPTRCPVGLDCVICGDGPLLSGDLAVATESGELPDTVRRWLNRQDWQVIGAALYCPSCRPR
ncbi:hypothetical protein AB0H00_19920 [Nocardia sp. NPDC023852]|uniref:hypothetical protein n=1 Tax=Nocardia sp. NPDC023852 TaxID=3154697 RepID=UPI0034060B17